MTFFLLFFLFYQLLSFQLTQKHILAPFLCVQPSLACIKPNFTFEIGILLEYSFSSLSKILRLCFALHQHTHVQHDAIFLLDVLVQMKLVQRIRRRQQRWQAKALACSYIVLHTVSLIVTKKQANTQIPEKRYRMRE